MPLLMHIWALVARYYWALRSTPSRVIRFFFWPLLDVVIWGFIGQWMAKTYDPTSALAWSFVLAMSLSYLVRGTNYELAFTLLDEIHAYNLINLFATPLKLYEWLLAITIYSGLLIMAALLYSMTLISILYGAPALMLFKITAVCAPGLFLAGLWLGFICLSLLLYAGKTALELIPIFGWLFVPFSGVFYPISILPVWAQKVSAFLPMSYFFESIRSYLISGVWNAPQLLIGYALALFYCVLSAGIFVLAFNWTKQYGLTRLEH